MYEIYIVVDGEMVTTWEFRYIQDMEIGTIFKAGATYREVKNKSKHDGMWRIATEQIAEQVV